MNGRHPQTGFENGRVVPISWPAEFVERETLSANVARAVDTKRLALAILDGHEKRSTVKTATELKLSATAVSRAVCRLAKACGMERYLKKSPVHRAKISAATSARWAAKKKRADQEPPRPALKDHQLLDPKTDDAHAGHL